MGTHGSFGVYFKNPKDMFYITQTSDGMPENLGEYLLSVLRTEGIVGYMEAMRDAAVTWEDSGFDLASNEEMPEWTFSDWVYLYRHWTGELLVCYPECIGKEKGNLGITGKNPYSKYTAALSILLEVAIWGTETVMDVYRRTRSLKRVGRYLTLYK